MAFLNVIRTQLARVSPGYWIAAAGAAVGGGIYLAMRDVPANPASGAGGTVSPSPSENQLSGQPLRDAALSLLTMYLPCHQKGQGQEKFEEIAKDYGNMGTTCGYLTGWLLWRLGCRDNQIVNRSEPAEGLHYAVAMNIAKLVNGGKALGAWRTQEGGARPKLGDLCYYATDPPTKNADGSSNYHEHVNVAVDCSGDLWKSADGGRTDPNNGKQMMEFVSRKRFANGSIDYLGGARKLIGWVDLEAVPRTAPPDLTTVA